MVKFTRAVLRADSGRKYACTTRDQIRTKLAKEEQTEFEAALKDRTISLSAIQRALVARGILVNTTTLGRHRSGRCKECYGVPR
jgi:hypothetical protein